MKALPWIIAALLLAGLVAMTVNLRGTIATKDGELQAAEQRYKELQASSEQKQQELVAQLAAVDAKAQRAMSEAQARVHAIASEANEKLSAANLPEVTVSVGFRKALFSSGSVALIKNIGSQPSAFSLLVARPALNQQRVFELTVDPQMVKELGEREGWAFLRGDKVRVSQPGHKSLVFSFE